MTNWRYFVGVHMYYFGVDRTKTRDTRRAEVSLQLNCITSCIYNWK